MDTILTAEVRPFQGPKPALQAAGTRGTSTSQTDAGEEGAVWRRPEVSLVSEQLGLSSDPANEQTDAIVRARHVIMPTNRFRGTRLEEAELAGPLRSLELASKSWVGVGLCNFKLNLQGRDARAPEIYFSGEIGGWRLAMSEGRSIIRAWA